MNNPRPYAGKDPSENQVWFPNLMERVMVLQRHAKLLREIAEIERVDLGRLRQHVLNALDGPGRVA